LTFASGKHQTMDFYKRDKKTWNLCMVCRSKRSLFFHYFPRQSMCKRLSPEEML